MTKLHVSALLSGILLANPASAAIVTYLVEGDVTHAPYGDGWGLAGSHMVWEMVFDTNTLPTYVQTVPGAPGGGVQAAYDPLSTSLTFSNRPSGQSNLVLSPDASLSTINYNDMPGGYDNMTLDFVTGNPGITYMFFGVDLGLLSSFFGPDGTAAPVPTAIAPGDIQDLISYHDFNTEAGYYSLSNASFMVSAVPVPGAFWLLGSGLVAMLGLRRSKTPC